jgi:hypothetical protein
LVALRLRNPCSRLRRILLGWYVRFTARASLEKSAARNHAQRGLSRKDELFPARTPFTAAEPRGEQRSLPPCSPVNAVHPHPRRSFELKRSVAAPALIPRRSANIGDPT